MVFFPFFIAIKSLSSLSFRLSGAYVCIVVRLPPKYLACQMSGMKNVVAYLSIVHRHMPQTSSSFSALTPVSGVSESMHQV